MTLRKSASLTKQIAEANKALGAALAAGDTKGVAAMYSKTAVLMAPNMPAAKSRAKIKAFWDGAVSMGIKTATLKTSEVESSGSTAVEVGNYRLAGAKNKTMDTGKYIVIWKREGKNWKLHRDIFNSNQ